MAATDGLLEVGRFGRPHGVRGQIYLKLSTDRAERVKPGNRIFAGEWLEIATSQPMFNTGPDRWVVSIVGVDDRNKAEALVNKAVFAEPINDPDAVWVHQVIGARVVDSNGIDRGVCVGVLSNPANDLLELDTGALVPALFVREVTEYGGGFRCVVDAPEGLFDIESND